MHDRLDIDIKSGGEEGFRHAIASSQCYHQYPSYHSLPLPILRTLSLLSIGCELVLYPERNIQRGGPTLTSQNPLLSSRARYGLPVPPLPFLICPFVPAGAFGSQPSRSILPAHSAQCIGRNAAELRTIDSIRRSVPVKVSIWISVGRESRAAAISICDASSECS